MVCNGARVAFKHGDAHARALMMGAALSDACVSIHDRVLDPCATCALCCADIIPSWFHVCWECHRFASARPGQPDCPLQKRFAWPTADCH